MFYYNVSEESKFQRSAKNSNYYQTNYLKTTATEIKENDENEAAHQMLKIPRVGDWENREREKSTSTNTISRLGTKKSGKKKGARQQTI